MKRIINFFAVFSTLLATVLSAPNPFPSPSPTPQKEASPLAAIGNFIQRIQTSFQEGTSAIGPPTGNAYSLPLSIPPTTTTTTTTTPRPPPVKNPFNSINAILDNISRNTKSTGSVGNRLDDNIFGQVPGRSLNLPPLTTPRPFFPAPTTRSPFNLDGINQGINAFFQAFLKTNIDKIFKPPQDQLNKRDIEPRNDLGTSRPPSLGEIFGNLFRKQNN